MFRPWSLETALRNASNATVCCLCEGSNDSPVSCLAFRHDSLNRSFQLTPRDWLKLNSMHDNDNDTQRSPSNNVRGLALQA